jgi:hypothetical protein
MPRPVGAAGGVVSASTSSTIGFMPMTMASGKVKLKSV